MVATKRVRWECPNGHPAVLGSTRPARNSVVRYCLKCSEKEGVLVERIAPVLEAKRAAAKDSAAAKAKAKRAKRAADAAAAVQRETERYTVDGLDLRVEFKRLIKLRVFGGKQGTLYRRPPKLVVRQCKQHPRTRMGSADYWANQINVSKYPGQDAAGARETLLHELVHIFTDHQLGPTGETPHGPRFRKNLRLAMREAYGVDPVTFDVYHGTYAAAIRRKAE